MKLQQNQHFIQCEFLLWNPRTCEMVEIVGDFNVGRNDDLEKYIRKCEKTLTKLKELSKDPQVEHLDILALK